MKSARAILIASAIGAAGVALAAPKRRQRGNADVDTWLWPVPSCSRISSLWGLRENPFKDESSPAECHRGLDIPCGTGAPVVSSRMGFVETSRLAGTAGNMVEVRHADGSKSRYMHLSRLDAKVGDLVDRGEVIGAIGTTGRSTGPHLHFEIRTASNVSVDPGPLLGVGAGVPC